MKIFLQKNKQKRTIIRKQRQNKISYNDKIKRKYK